MCTWYTRMCAYMYSSQVIYVLTVSVGRGLAFGGQTFFSQTYGSDNKKLVGVYLQKGPVSWTAMSNQCLITEAHCKQIVSNWATFRHHLRISLGASSHWSSTQHRTDPASDWPAAGSGSWGARVHWTVHSWSACVLLAVPDNAMASVSSTTMKLPVSLCS